MVHAWLARYIFLLRQTWDEDPKGRPTFPYLEEGLGGLRDQIADAVNQADGGGGGGGGTGTGSTEPKHQQRGNAETTL
jgi:hypothetical protein